MVSGVKADGCQIEPEIPLFLVRCWNRKSVGPLCEKQSQAEMLVNPDARRCLLRYLSALMPFADR